MDSFRVNRLIKAPAEFIERAFLVKLRKAIILYFEKS